jgi:hypothetical protein
LKGAKKEAEQKLSSVGLFQAHLRRTEGRVHILDAQLLQLEGAKKEAEQKLNSVGLF